MINKNICIPKIKEKNEKKLLILSEDLGDMRFDKIMTNKSKKELLKYAVDNLIILKNSFIFDKSMLLERYNINIFEVFIPMIQVEKTDTAIVQWTIIKN